MNTITSEASGVGMEEIKKIKNQQSLGFSAMYREVGALRYACMYNGIPVRDIHRLSDDLIALTLENKDKRDKTSMIFLSQPSFQGEKTGEIIGNPTKVPDDLSPDKWAPSISVVYGVGFTIDMAGTGAKRHFTINGNTIQVAEESKKKSISSHLANRWQEEHVSDSGELLTIRKSEWYIFGGVAKGSPAEGDNSGAYRWVKKTGERDLADGKKQMTWTNVTLKTTNGDDIVDVIDKHFKLFEREVIGVSIRYGSNNKNKYVFTDLNKDGRVEILEFFTGTPKKAIIPNVIRVPKKGQIFVIWTGQGKECFFRKKLKTDGTLEEIPAERVYKIGPSHDYEEILEIDPSTGYILPNPDSVAEKMTHLIEGGKVNW